MLGMVIKALLQLNPKIQPIEVLLLLLPSNTSKCFLWVGNLNYWFLRKPFAYSYPHMSLFFIVIMFPLKCLCMLQLYFFQYSTKGIIICPSKVMLGITFKEAKHKGEGFSLRVSYKGKGHWDIIRRGLLGYYNKGGFKNFLYHN